jgi:2-aminobenzoate-CoA ligase
MGTAHTDTFARDNLPPPDQQPEFLFNRPEFDYEERLNCVSAFLDDWVARGHGDAPCLIASGGTLSYVELQRLVNRIANVLTRRLGLVPGGRVLLRSANTPMMVAAYLAILKAGGIVVATMPLLRAKELAYPIAKAKIGLALCDIRLAAEMEKAKASSPDLKTVLYWGADDAKSLDRLLLDASDAFAAVDTASDDICLIGFTSGTTGEPKGTMHYHRDMLAICDGFSGNVLRPTAADRFIGSPPLAFTFGLGGLVLFPMRVGASTVLVEKPSPDELLPAIEAHRPTILFTAPTAYRAMLPRLKEFDMSSLVKCVSAGEALPRPTYEAWLAATGIKLMDGIGSTEMLHIFISATVDEIRPGATGKPVPGYEAKVIDAAGQPVPPGAIGRLAVRGPTGCRYLADDRQAKYVEHGWNVTGDTFIMDQDGYFWYQARSDDMIISAGYNIAGPEVEVALLGHPIVRECGVVGVGDDERGQLVKAYIVLEDGIDAGPAQVEALQSYVKAEIAPYKYPRLIEFVSALPRTETGKLKRFELRRMAESLKTVSGAPAAGGTPQG